MTTDTTTRFVGVLSALMMTLALNGGVLFMFDDLAQQTEVHSTVVSLETVTIVGKRV